MRVGMTVLPEHSGESARKIWASLEEYGFDHGWTFDHLGWDGLLDGPWYGTVPTLTLAALVTSRLEIGTLVASPNFRHPVAFSRDLIGLDEISEGRLTLGVGAGAESGYDVDVFGAGAPKSRVRRFGEFVELLDRLLREDHVSFEGDYYSAVDARSVPGCRQRPRLPFIVAANGPGAASVAARYGQGWVTIGGRAERLDAWWGLVSEASDRMTAALAVHGREGDPAFRRMLQTDAAPVLSIQSADCFDDFLGRADELGFTDVVAPWPRAQGPFSAPRSVVDRIAADVLPRWRTSGSDRP